MARGPKTLYFCGRHKWITPYIVKCINKQFRLHVISKKTTIETSFSVTGNSWIKSSCSMSFIHSFKKIISLPEYESGSSIPQSQWCIFPPISEHDSESVKNFHHGLTFIQQNFRRPFLIIHSNFLTFPIFSQNVYISTYFGKNSTFPPNFAKLKHFPLFSLNLRFFASPDFDHDAFMHHALHVLDTPGLRKTKRKTCWWTVQPLWLYTLNDCTHLMTVHT